MQTSGHKIIAQLYEADDATSGAVNIVINNINESGKSSQLAETISVPSPRNSGGSVSESSRTDSQVMNIVINNNNTNTNNVSNVTNNTIVDTTRNTVIDIPENVRPKIVPHSLRKELVLLLDPKKTMIGSDWRDLASALGKQDCIDYLDTTSGSPTEHLLNVVEELNILLPELRDMMLAIDRRDCAEAIDSHIRPQQVDTATFRHRVASENEYNESVHVIDIDDTDLTLQKRPSLPKGHRNIRGDGVTLSADSGLMNDLSESSWHDSYNYPSSSTHSQSFNASKTNSQSFSNDLSKS